MYGWYKLINQTHDEMQIGYSLEKNKTCDGLLIYNKLSEKFITRRLSKGSVLKNCAI